LPSTLFACRIRFENESGVSVPVIRPFALADVLLIYRLQGRSMPLAIEHELTHPRSPLWLALTAPWPWAGWGVATYVLRERSLGRTTTGYVQLLKRSARPEADILHMAPATLPGEAGSAAHNAASIATITGEDAVAETVWRRLLAHVSLAAAQHGVQRLYAGVPDGGPALGCLRDAGFSLYTRETIYRMDALPTLPNSSMLTLRRQSRRDTWALQRLYTRSTPCLVQQAEGALTGDAGSPPLSWWEPDRWRGYIWAPAGEVRGAVQVHIGRNGHWLRIWGANALSQREVRGLVEQGARVLANLPARAEGPRPVYATVRDYDGGLSAALTDLGFAPFTDRARFVKYTVATRRVQAPAALPVREAAPEPLVRGTGAQPYRCEKQRLVR
jgi:hypothetical protein